MDCARCKKLNGSSKNYKLPELLPFVNSGKTIAVGGGHKAIYWGLCKDCRPIVMEKMKDG